jgi:hypothetical protein
VIRAIFTLNLRFQMHVLRLMCPGEKVFYLKMLCFIADGYYPNGQVLGKI